MPKSTSFFWKTSGTKTSLATWNLPLVTTAELWAMLTTSTNAWAWNCFSKSCHLTALPSSTKTWCSSSWRSALVSGTNSTRSWLWTRRNVHFAKGSVKKSLDVKHAITATSISRNRVLFVESALISSCLRLIWYSKKLNWMRKMSTRTLKLSPKLLKSRKLIFRWKMCKSLMSAIILQDLTSRMLTAQEIQFRIVQDSKISSHEILIVGIHWLSLQTITRWPLVNSVEHNSQTKGKRDEEWIYNLKK